MDGKHVDTLSNPESSERDVESKEYRPPGLENTLTSCMAIARRVGCMGQVQCDSTIQINLTSHQGNGSGWGWDPDMNIGTKLHHMESTRQIFFFLPTINQSLPGDACT